MSFAQSKADHGMNANIINSSLPPESGSQHAQITLEFSDSWPIGKPTQRSFKQNGNHAERMSFAQSKVGHRTNANKGN
jgi:hypothetical protein